MSDRVLIERYEVVRGGVSLHVYRDDDGLGCAVWLNTTIENEDSGTIIGLGRSRAAAVKDAVKMIEELERVLQGPPVFLDVREAVRSVRPWKRRKTA